MGRIIATGRGLAHNWYCDHMGHLNTRFYAAFFDDASFQLLEEIAPKSELGEANLGWADVSFSLLLRHEISVGSTFHIDSELLRLGTKSITYRHKAVSADRSIEYATAEVVTVLFDLKVRAAVAFDERLRRRCAALLNDGDEPVVQPDASPSRKKPAD